MSNFAWMGITGGLMALLLAVFLVVGLVRAARIVRGGGKIAPAYRAQVLQQIGLIAGLLSTVLQQVGGASLWTGIAILVGLPYLIGGYVLDVRARPEFWGQRVSLRRGLSADVERKA